MRFALRGRQPLALLLLGIVIVSISILVQLTHVLRLATDAAAEESGLVVQTLLLQIGHVAQREPSSPMRALQEDPRIDLILQAATAQAPAVLFVAIADPSRNAVAHTIPEMVGSRLDPLPPLPRVRTLAESAALLVSLLRSPQVYGIDAPLQLGDRPFASIRVGIAGVLLRDQVQEAFRRGIPGAGIQIALAVALGFVLAGLASKRLRQIEAGVAALREGRFESRIPESGVDEFSRLVRDLNLLSEKFERERLDRIPAALQEADPMMSQSRILTRLGQMAAGVAHEIRNPLQAINLELGILGGSRSLPPEEVERHVRMAQEEIQRLQRAVSGFLKIARMRPVAPAPLRLNELLEEVQQSMKAEAGLSGLDLDLDLFAELPETYADREVMRQAVENLVKNALQALPSRDGRVILQSRAVDSEIRVSVADTGPGIPPEHIEKVFDLYFTTKEGGTGVGLPLVRQALEMHAGDVEVDSDQEKGTVVTLRLPIRVKAARA